jgi:hypothetical protein
MSIIQGTAKGGLASFYDFPIGDSLRFDGSSYLSRTPSTAGNRKTWTWSGWVKLGNLSSDKNIFGGNLGSQIDGGVTLSNSNNIGLSFNGNTYNKYASNVLRDISAWYHFVFALDTDNATAADRIKIYVNGVEQTNYFTQNSGLPPSGYTPAYLNNANNHDIGKLVGYSLNYFDGYLANIQFIDGQALDASYFGETKQDIWVPKTFDGTSSTGGSTVSTDYGTNGFLLDFSSISGTTINDTAPIDTNHSSANNWTATGF